MHNQPIYQVEPVGRTIPAHSARRQVRFFLLCVLNALVLIGVDPFDIVTSRQPHTLNLLIQQQVDFYSPALGIISVGFATLALACLATVVLDSFALFLPAPRLQRWTTRSYLAIGVLIGLIALILVLSAISDDSCPAEPTYPPCVEEVIGG